MKVLKPHLSAPLSTKAESPPYLYRILPHVDNTLAAISSDDTLRAFTADGLRVVSEGKHDGVTCLERGPGELKGQAKILLTAGRNAVVNLWDGRGDKSMAIVEPGGPLGTPITSLASSIAGNMFATGFEQAHSVAAVSVWDIRKSKVPVVHYAEVHNDDVTELAFSDHLPANMLSGSTDGLVNVYDTSVQDEDDALLQVANHGASIHHAGFISSSSQASSTEPLDALVYALSHDETLSLYPRSDAASDDEGMAEVGENGKGDSTVAFGDIRPRLDVEYAVDVLTISNTVVLAAGRHSDQWLDLIPLLPSPQWNFRREDIVRLEGAHGEEIVRTIYVDERTNAIYTGGEDGLVKIWKPEDSLLGAETLPTEKMGAPSKQKKKKTKHHKPY